MKKVFMCAFMCAFMCGCSGVQEVAVVHDTLFSEHWHIDTTFIDQWHEVEIKGDTVREQSTRTIYRSKYIHDTIKEVEQIPQPYPVRVEVEKPLTLWQRVCIAAGKIALLACLVIAAFCFIKYRKI